MRYFTYTLLAILISTMGMAQKTCCKQTKALKTVVYSPELISDELSSKVNEQSGMVWHNDLFWVS